MTDSFIEKLTDILKLSPSKVTNITSTSLEIFEIFYFAYAKNNVQYLSIRYAKSPTATRRFKPPEPQDLCPNCNPINSNKSVEASTFQNVNFGRHWSNFDDQWSFLTIACRVLF